MRKWLLVILASGLTGCTYYDKAVDKLHAMDMKKTFAKLSIPSPKRKNNKNENVDESVITQGHERTQVDVAQDSWEARTVLFGYDQSSFSKQDQDMVINMAGYLKKHPRGKVKIFGHTDERGSSEYNIALGWRRALAVASKLESLGVMPKQMEVVSYGKEQPKLLGHSELHWKQNRRVEFKYMG